MTESTMNGQRFYTARETGAVYIPLPRDAWRSAGRCDCKLCHGNEGFWDTVVVPGDNDRQAYTFTVHFPELQTDEPPRWLVRGRL